MCLKRERHDINLPPGGGALITFTYGKVSPISLDLNVSKSDIFGSKLTEIIAMIFFGLQTQSN